MDIEHPLVELVDLHSRVAASREVIGRRQRCDDGVERMRVGGGRALAPLLHRRPGQSAGGEPALLGVGSLAVRVAGVGSEERSGEACGE
jgi:hypothetical protein